MKRLLWLLALSATLPVAAQEGELQILAPRPGERVQQLDKVTIVVSSGRPVATRSLSLSVNGSIIQTLSTPAPWKEARLTWDVAERAPGEYQLRVSAYTGRNRLQSPTIRVTVAEAPWYPAPRARSYALVVGVGQYQDTGISTLAYSGSDAKAIYRVLTDATRGAYPAANVTLMTDDSPPERQPTRNNLLGMLKNWLGQRGKDADSVMLYFSGHGVEENGKGYLVPKDAQAGLLADTAVDIARVNELLTETNARARILILDACHSAAGKDVGIRMTPGVAEQLFVSGEGRATLASCKQNQQSWEWSAKGQSVFTHYLVEALEGRADDNHDRGVSLDEANRYVHAAVTKWAADNKKQQEPRLKADLSGQVVLSGFASEGQRVRRPGWVAEAPAAPAVPAPPRPQPARPPALPAPGVPTPPTVGGQGGRCGSTPRTAWSSSSRPLGSLRWARGTRRTS